MAIISVVDYGVGNLGSVINMLKKIGASYSLAKSVQDIQAAEKLILPGVGAFDKAMHMLRQKNFIEVLNYKVLECQTPLLGICLGMQLLTNGSSEGQEKGFGWINASTYHFDKNGPHNIRVPHMGWNLIFPKKDHPLLDSLDAQSRFYFCHSYFVRCNDKNNVLATTEYGDNFDAIIGQGNIMGAQFHPEKSHKFGMQLFKNFKDRY